VTRHFAFLALLIVSTCYALAKGDRPERIGAFTLCAGALLSVWVARPLGPRFRHIEVGILAIDIAILGIFLWLSLRSTRFWPLWIAALLGTEVIVHLGVMVAPTVVREAYMDAVAMWSWAAQVILAVATWRHRTRLKRMDADVPWKPSLP
jgi:peptidoglycan biosynthesis protein MviN/MurJ (putative lipid II flippase)